MKNRQIIYSLVFSLTCSFAHAQQVPVKEKKIGDNGTPTFLLFDTDSTQYQKGEEETIWKEYLNITSSDQLEKVKSRTDKQGMEHLVFQQYYRGIKVENATFRVHLKEELVESVNGNFIKIDNLNINPALSGEEAVLIALKNTNAQKYAWESEKMEKTLKEETGSASASYYPEAELVIWHPYRKNETSLAYKIEIYSLEPQNHEYVYVDANNGAVLDRDPISISSAVTGTADTRYSGSQNLTTDSFVSGFRLRDPSRGNGIETYDMNEGTDYGNAVDFVDNNNTWTAAEWHNIQMDDAALDAHWALQEVYDYFVAEHGRESYDDANGKVKCYVHFGQNWGNAQWDGDKIRLGDGNNNFRILAAFDVIAHEFGHGVCQETCALEYEKESGAINESLSDIWAATIEEYSVPLKQEWRIGEEITLNTTALRAMDNPNLLGQPDTYGGTFWTNPECGTPSDGNDYCGVHTNSGVMNFWFYLLAEGGTGTNDNGDCYFVEGIGIEDAAEIVYSLEADYLDDESNFDAARTYSIQAARNLNEEIQISNAWYAVGVGDEYQYQISGPSTVCSSGSTFSVSNPPTIDSIIWSIGPNLTIYSGQNSNSPIIKATGTGNSWVQARLVTGCGSLTLPQRTVWAGIPDYTQLDIYANNSGGSHIILACDYTSADALYAGSSGHAIGFDAYEWDMPYATNWDIYEEYGGGGIDMRYVEIEYWESPPPSTEVIGIRAHNTCGWSPWRNIIVNVENHCSRLYMSFSPNPTTGETTLTIQSSSEKEILDVNQEWDLEVYTQTQVLKAKKIRLKGSSTVINTSGWQEGVYVVRALYNNEVITGKLIVKR